MTTDTAISGRNLTNSCKFLTDEIINAQNFKFLTKEIMTA